MSNNEDIGKSFRELLNYISSLGNHVNQIYDRLEKIESSIKETKEELESSITNNEKELKNIREIVVTKSEFNELIKKLYGPFEEFSPPKTPEQIQE